MGDRISNKAFDFMTTAVDETGVFTDDGLIAEIEHLEMLEKGIKSLQQKQKYYPDAYGGAFSKKAMELRKNNFRELLFQKFLDNTGLYPFSDRGLDLKTLWREGGSPVILEKEGEDLMPWLDGKRYDSKGNEIGRPFMYRGFRGSPDEMHINIGSEDNFVEELAHSYDYGNRTEAARDSLYAEARRTRKLYGDRDVYGKWDSATESYLYPKGDGVFGQFVEDETDPKAMTPEYRTHRIIAKALWDKLNKSLGE